MYNNPYMYGGAGSGMNFGTNPYYSPYMQNQAFQQQNMQAQAQPQPQQQPVQNQPQQTSVATNKIYVNGLNDVKGKYQATNSDVIYFDNDNPNIIYEKIVDGTGHFDVKTFSIADFKPIEPQKQDEANKLSDYVLKTDLEPLQAEIKALQDKIEKLNMINKLNDMDKGTK